MVGQNVQSLAADARSANTYKDAETILDRLDLHTQGGLKAILDRLDEIAPPGTALGTRPAPCPALRAGASHPVREPELSAPATSLTQTWQCDLRSGPMPTCRDQPRVAARSWSLCVASVRGSP